MPWVIHSIEGWESFDSCTERYKIVDLLPNSELTKGNNMSNADAHTLCLRRETMADMRYDLGTINSQ